MDIRQYSEGKTRLFELTLNRKELGDIDSGAVECLVSPRAPAGATFYLYNHQGEIGRAFVADFHDSSGYFIYVGAESQRAGRDWREWGPRDLENAMRSRGRIPIETMVVGGVEINPGFVELKVNN